MAPYSGKTCEERYCNILICWHHCLTRQIQTIKATPANRKTQEKAKAEARGLFCSWAIGDLDSMLEIAGQLGMSQPGGSVRSKKRGAHSKGERYQINTLI